MYSSYFKEKSKTPAKNLFLLSYYTVLLNIHEKAIKFGLHFFRKKLVSIKHHKKPSPLVNVSWQKLLSDLDQSTSVLHGFNLYIIDTFCIFPPVIPFALLPSLTYYTMYYNKAMLYNHRNNFLPRIHVYYKITKD